MKWVSNKKSLAVPDKESHTMGGVITIAPDALVDEMQAIKGNAPPNPSSDIDDRSSGSGVLSSGDKDSSKMTIHGCSLAITTNLVIVEVAVTRGGEDKGHGRAATEGRAFSVGQPPIVAALLQI